jgi:HAE1 family hydrophobic/amphiphilic exporter-1/multidrug efflux pump
VQVSIREVLKTLGEAMVLVFLVVYLFLQSWRAAIIPFAAVPVSLIGAFAGIYALGYSINTLTLFAMVLAIGIVVDDAIVVLENVERHMREDKLAPRDAALKAMREVTGPIIAIVLTLTAVFVPIAFLGGLTGELYRQFAVTIAMSVVISGFVALTLSPALSALILKPHEPPNRFFAWFNDWFTRVTGRYNDGVIFMLRHGILSIVLFLVMVGVTAWLWRTTPGSLVPDEDQGFYIAAVILPDGATLTRTDKVVSEVAAAIRSNPNNQDIVAFTGFDFIGGGFRNNAATIFVTQKPWDERKVTASQLVGELFAKTANIKEAVVLAFNPPPIFGLGTAGGFEFYIQNHGEGGAKRLDEVKNAFLAKANADPMFAGRAQTLWRATVPQLHIDVDREKAKTLGIPISDIFAALSATLGNYYINDFNKYGRAWQVLMSAEPGYRNRPDDIGAVYVRSAKGEMIPLSSLVTVKYSSGPDVLDRFNNLPAVKILGQAAPGYSSGQAIAELEKIAAETLPSDFSYDWGGTSYQEKKSTGAATFSLALAVVMVFLILAAQYERLSLPLSVLLALPFGTFGALAAIHLRGLTNDVYFQIGLVTLLGLAAKNAILIVEFAVLKTHEGMTPSAAAIEAARLRFRPILMTSLAFILGVTPLAISTGAGAGARHSTGTGVMGGMLAATFLAIFFVPLFYRVIAQRRLVEKRSHDELVGEVKHARGTTRHVPHTPGHPPIPAHGDD